MGDSAGNNKAIVISIQTSHSSGWETVPASCLPKKTSLELELVSADAQTNKILEWGKPTSTRGGPPSLQQSTEPSCIMKFFRSLAVKIDQQT